jgi:hypothetical protein|tara:strand:- start:263 stop:460 length:198 start_codon:yes stop_codon:yes gene_type:complete
MKKISWIACAYFIAININATAQHDTGRNTVKILANVDFEKINFHDTYSANYVINLISMQLKPIGI